MEVEAEKKTRTQDSERTINGQDFVVAKPTAVVNRSSIDVDFIKKGFWPTYTPPLNIFIKESRFS